MRVLHVISSGGMYGAEAVILDLCRGLRRAGHEGVICLFVNSENPNLELGLRAERDGIRTITIPCAGQLDRSVPSQLLAAAAEVRAEVVHSHGYKADVYAGWASRRSQLPFMATCHNWIDGDWALRLYGLLDRLALRRFAAVIAVSEEVRGRLLRAGLHPNRVHLIRNGVDIEALMSIERPPMDAPVKIGMAARLSPEKGVDLFVRAAAKLAGRMQGVSFRIAGDGPERRTLETLAADRGLADRLTFAGRQEDMAAFYASLDVLVLPSRQEGLPMALLEGMASGLPIVASTVGEMPQVVLHEHTGLLVAPGDVDGLESAMASLASSSAVRRRMGAEGRARVIEHFSADHMTEQYLAVYQAIAADGRRRAA